jgi:hypothetical protein
MQFSKRAGVGRVAWQLDNLSVGLAGSTHQDACTYEVWGKQVEGPTGTGEGIIMKQPYQTEE